MCKLKAFALLLLATLVPACENEREADHHRDYRRADKTPSGFHVEFEDRGTLATGLMTKEEIYRIFDKAFIDAAYVFEKKNGIPIQDFFSAPHDHELIFRIIDGWRYYSPVGGWVYGEYYTDGVIWLSFWDQRLLVVGQDVPNPWTLDVAYGNTYVGMPPNSQRLRDLIVHEMGHLYFGPTFGH